MMMIMMMHLDLCLELFCGLYLAPHYPSFLSFAFPVCSACKAIHVLFLTAAGFIGMVVILKL